MKITNSTEIDSNNHTKFLSLTTFELYTFFNIHWQLSRLCLEDFSRIKFYNHTNFLRPTKFLCHTFFEKLIRIKF